MCERPWFEDPPARHRREWCGAGQWSLLGACGCIVVVVRRYWCGGRAQDVGHLCPPPLLRSSALEAAAAPALAEAGLHPVQLMASTATHRPRPNEPNNLTPFSEASAPSGTPCGAAACQLPATLCTHLPLLPSPPTHLYPTLHPSPHPAPITHAPPPPHHQPALSIHGSTGPPRCMHARFPGNTPPSAALPHPPYNTTYL